MFNDNNRYSTYESVIRQREGLGSYLSRVFGWMFIGLLATAITAFYVAGSRTIISIFITNPILFFGLVIAEFGLVAYLSARITRISYGTALSLFLAYSVLNGVTLSTILLAYTLSSVSYTFIIAASTFGIMSLYGLITRTDLTRAGNLLFMGLIGIVILSLVNMFLHASSLEWLISFVGLFVFLGLTAYDTQMIKQYYYAADGNPEMLRKIPIMGALRLYLDFVNLFLMLLRFFGRRR